MMETGSSPEAADAPRASRSRKLVGLGQLALCLLLLVLVWGILLPQLAQSEPVARHSRMLEEYGVDASAVFYTELNRDLYLTDVDVRRRRER